MNYGITKKDFLAIVEFVRHFSGVLRVHPVTIVTDHQQLVAYMSCQQTDQMMIRWQGKLSQLDITIEHMDRKKNVIADALSSTYKESPSASTKQSVLSTDHCNSTLVLPTTTTQYLPVKFATSTTLPSITTMPSQMRTIRRMSNMSGRNANTDAYQPEDWELKIHNECDDN